MHALSGTHRAARLGRGSAPASLQPGGGDGIAAEAQRTAAWPVGGRAVRDPDRLTAEWAFGGDPPGLVELADDDHRPPSGAGRGAGRALVIGCGALARELLAVVEPIPGLDVACLAPDLHNRPEGIPDAVRRRIQRARADGYGRVFVAYADCGTGGLLDPVLADEGVERLPGAHCYEVFAGTERFAAMADAEPGTFWLTDFLARNFDRLVIRGLGIDRHPELLPMYFAHYTRVVYLSQGDDPALVVAARAAADRLGLAFEHRRTGLEHLAAPLRSWAQTAPMERWAPAGRGVASFGPAEPLDEMSMESRSVASVPPRPLRPTRGTSRFRAERVPACRGTRTGAEPHVGEARR